MHCQQGRAAGLLKAVCANGEVSRACRALKPWIQRRRQPHEQRAGRLERCNAATLDAAVAEEEPALHIESVSYKQGAYAVEGRLASTAPAQLVYDVLTDYAALPRIFHNVEDCSVRVTEGGDKHLVQTVSWRFLIFCGSFVTELQVEERAAHRQLGFSLLRSPFMRQFVGSWDVRESPGGGSEISHALRILPVVSPPQRIGDITKSIFVQQVKGILEDLRAELDRRALESEGPGGS